MTRRNFPSPFAAIVCLFCGAFPALSPHAGAGTLVSFSALIGNDSRNAAVEMVDADGTAYASLSSLVRQLGGETGFSPTRAHVDFAGYTAWLTVGKTGIEASFGALRLQHPVLRSGDDLLVALTDVAPLFQQAFRVELRQRVLDEGAPPTWRDGTTRVASEDLDVPVGAAAGPPRAVEDPIALRESVQAPRLPSLIAVDAGHGGPDEGVVGGGGLSEKDLCLAVALELGRLLQEEYGMKVVQTRKEDVLLPVDIQGDLPQARIVNYHGAELFISLHAGASEARAARGFEVFCPPEEGGRPTSPAGRTSGTAEALIHARESRLLAEALDQAMAGATGAAGRGVRAVRCRVFEHLDVPAVLIELGCLTNPAEESLLSSKEYQAQLARGVAEGIRAYAQGPAHRETGP